MTRYADVKTQTPHGPRPVPKGHIDRHGMRHPGEPADAARTPDWRLWAGVGVAAAATTALSVIALRSVLDLISGDDDEDDAPRRPRPARRAPRRYRGAPGYGAPTARRAARYDRALDMQGAHGRPRAPRSYGGAAPQPQRAPRPQPRPEPRSRGFMADLSHSANDVTTNILGVVGAINSAVSGFQQVAGRADGIVRDFVDAADRVQGFLHSRSGDRKVEPTRARPGVMTGRRARFVDLREDEKAAQDTRTHSL